ncbi:MAG: hypothetical protein NUV53_03500 [Patescibacteria group bacterium]|nr:hypothetical protein [Patescibacteria group bacterium]
MQNHPKIGDVVEFVHPFRGHTVVGTFKGIVDDFYFINDVKNGSPHFLAIVTAKMFNFRVIGSDESSHAE